MFFSTNKWTQCFAQPRYPIVVTMTACVAAVCWFQRGQICEVCAACIIRVFLPILLCLFIVVWPTKDNSLNVSQPSCAAVPHNIVQPHRNWGYSYCRQCVLDWFRSHDRTGADVSSPITGENLSERRGCLVGSGWFLGLLERSSGKCLWWANGVVTSA